MTTPVLTTKLHVPPPRPNLVPRPRLFERWIAGLEQGGRLTLLSAPAGFGKTTVMAEWAFRLRSTESVPGSAAPDGMASSCPRIHSPRTMVAWLSLDPEDDDPVHLWTYLVAALQTVRPELGKPTLRLLGAPQPPMAQTVLTPLLNEVAAQPDRIVLFLEDYHLISDKIIHDGVAFWLDRQPANCHLVIATRADPPLPTFRWRARGELVEFRSDDLRFTPTETTAFLTQVAGLDLEPGDVQALDSRTEGWIVGLQLAALALAGRLPSQGRADTREFISAFSGSHRYVLEYLIEEVVRRQPQPVREFLIQTSILDRLCGPLCDAVVSAGDGAQDAGKRTHHGGGRTEDAGLRMQDSGVLAPEYGASSSSARWSLHGQEMLAELERRNLFLVPLGDQRRWYRYHHLFADLLRNLLHRELPAERIAGLHRRAGRWFEGEGESREAIHHVLQAGDLERAASLIEAAGQEALSEGRLVRLLGWLEALPPALMRSRPRLGLYQGWALHLSGQTDIAARLLQEQKDVLDSLPPSPENEALRGEAAALLTAVATVHGDMAKVVQEAREALTYLPEESCVSRARVLVALGTAHAYGDETEKAMQTWRQARDLALQAGNPFLATAAIELLAGTQVYQQGRLREGAETLQGAIALGTAPDGSRLPFSGTAHALLAAIYLEWNDRVAAAGCLQQGVELNRLGGIGYSLIYPYCTKARLEQAAGEAEGALEALRMAEQALEARPLWHMIVHLASCQVRFRLWQGDVGSAASWARLDRETIGQESSPDLPLFLRARQQTALARVYLAQGTAAKALATLDGLRAQEEAASGNANLIEIHLVRALALAAQGKTMASLESLERSLALAEPEGYVRLFLEEGDSLAALLREVTVRGRFAAYAQRLLEASPDAIVDGGGGAQAPEGSLARDSSDYLIEPLTPRELKVLQLICEGLPNREIAQRLTVTLNTVKKHNSNIYGKLEVTSRAQAIVRARELGLC